jgi:hypothetical protein
LVLIKSKKCSFFKKPKQKSEIKRKRKRKQIKKNRKGRGQPNLGHARGPDHPNQPEPAQLPLLPLSL